MKKLVALFAITFMIASCSKREDYTYYGPSVHYKTIEIENCEYILGTDEGAYNGGYFLTHKGNCKNTIHNYK